MRRLLFANARKMYSHMQKNLSTKANDTELGLGHSIGLNDRLMRPDGVFIVHRQSRTRFDNVYHDLITISWTSFFLVALAVFVVINIFFALTYLLLGIEHLSGIEAGSTMDNFLNAYFFSSQTLTTVGYGHISPNGLATSIVASIESFLGLLTFALVSGLLYGRFSRPQAIVMFSEHMLVAPYKDTKGLMFRMGNARKSELIETEVQIVVALNQTNDAGTLVKRYYTLPLEINKISFFSLSWTVVHALNESSPLYGFSQEDLINARAEFLILVKGVDETNQQSVHSRHSYIAEEIIWNAKFTPIIGRDKRGMPYLLNKRIGDYEEVSN